MFSHFLLPEWMPGADTTSVTSSCSGDFVAWLP